MADLSANQNMSYSLTPRAAVAQSLGQVSSAIGTANNQLFTSNNISGGISFSPVSVVKTGDGSWQMGGGLNYDIPLASIQQFQNNAMDFSAANSSKNRSSLLGLFDMSNSSLSNSAAASRAYLGLQASTVDSTLNSVSQRAMGLTGTALGASERIAMMNAQVAQNTANQMFQTVRYQEQQTTERTRIQMQNQGGGDGGLCFLTTAVCENWGLADDCIYLQTLRKFRDEVMKPSREWAPLVDMYYLEAPEIVTKIKARPDRADIWDFVGTVYIIPAVASIEACDYENAVAIYKRMHYLLKAIAGAEI